jgi:hypothetical protein
MCDPLLGLAEGRVFFIFRLDRPQFVHIDGGNSLGRTCVDDNFTEALASILKLYESDLVGLFFMPD